tara:strand:+ start:3381 stop:3656 length:276 start_codon:yes stop_codon:yes gene_type:complete
MILKDTGDKDMNNDKYNGWTNRETWLINLHFEPRNLSDLDFINDEIITYAKKIQELPYGMFFTDFLDLSKINWYELKNHVQENYDDACEAE